MNIPKEQIHILYQCVIEFDSYIKINILQHIQQNFLNKIPSDLKSLKEDIIKISEIFHSVRANKSIDYVDIDDNYLPILSRSVIKKRAEVAKQVDEPLTKTFNPDLTEQLKQELLTIELLFSSDWFKATKPIKMPIISDYFTSKFIDSIDHEKMLERQYDEKFGILIAPGLFYSDLNYYIKKCSIRNCGLTVGYMDIDNFKNFNTKYGESVVDKSILPKFMLLLDSHFFLHGNVYRYGGDEYVFIIPNITLELTIKYLEELQIKLSKTHYDKIEEIITLSIGLFYVDYDSYYTEREIEKFAEVAKNQAKKEGKNRIAIYN